MNKIILKRQTVIGKIVETLKLLEGKEFDIKLLIQEIMSEHGVSKRTAQEYMSVAKYRFEHKI